jgi:hypothetical protein
MPVMTNSLEDAIQHLKDILNDPKRDWPCEECKKEHEQLLAWLEELKAIKDKEKSIQK